MNYGNHQDQEKDYTHRNRASPVVFFRLTVYYYYMPLEGAKLFELVKNVDL